MIEPEEWTVVATLSATASMEVTHPNEEEGTN